MMIRRQESPSHLPRWALVALVLLTISSRVVQAGEARGELNLSQVPYKIVYETFRDNNWELFIVNADGSGPVNLTRTPDVDEMYPHASPDGTEICFVADEGKGKQKVRNVYYMNVDGTGRTKVATNARQSCWSPDGTTIAYLKGEFEEYCVRDFATKGLFFYDLKTGKHTANPNEKIEHLYNICYSGDGNWVLATVHGGMGFKHATLAIEAKGGRVFDLGIPGCRPDVSPDGKKVAWGAGDWELAVGDLDFSTGQPRVTNRRAAVKSAEPIKIYHIDWSPDGKYVAFSRGPNHKNLGEAPEIVGVKAKDWNICVADAAGTGTWVAITTDGNCNKEPDWIPVAEKKVR